MTEQEQRIAIAEFCGWKHQEGEEIRYGGTTKTPGWFRPDGKFSKGRLGHKEAGLPDYLNDLNAMFAAEDTLSDSQVQLYIDHLAAVTGAVTIYSKLDLKCTNHWSIYHATAAQRAKAFLRAIGKWKD